MKLTWKRVRAHTRHAFRIARPGASVAGRDVERVIVRVEHGGIAGIGEAAPTPYYGQSLDSVEATLEQARDVLAAESAAADDGRLEPIVDALLARFDNQRAAVAAIDMALHDWLGRSGGRPVYRLLGLDPTATPPTSMTIGIDEPATIDRKVREAGDFTILKVKVGTGQDEHTLSLVRRAAAERRIRVDANGGWQDATVAAERIAALAGFGLELVEQPLPAGQLDEVRRLRARLEPMGIPLIADEDCVRPADLPRLAGVYDGINLKLAKCGGIVEALRMVRQARTADLSIMLGCMVETSVGVAAAAHLASLADYVDLDGHLLLADDPFAGLRLEAGTVGPGPDPGLGIRLRTPLTP